MRVLLAALLLGVSMPAFADNIAGCEVVLMEKIQQDGVEGSAEVASFRPAGDFIASIYDDETEVLRKIDGLPVRAIMCQRNSVVPSLRDFPIIASGTPFMISQNFDSTETGLTTIYFKDGEFRADYKGPKLVDALNAEMKDRLEVFNLQPHDLAEKEKAMLAKLESDAIENEVIEKPEADMPAIEDTMIEETVVEKTLAEESLAEESLAEESLAKNAELPINNDLIDDAKTNIEESTDALGFKPDMLGESIEDDTASARKTIKFSAPEELNEVE